MLVHIAVPSPLICKTVPKKIFVVAATFMVAFLRRLRGHEVRGYQFHFWDYLGTQGRGLNESYHGRPYFLKALYNFIHSSKRSNVPCALQFLEKFSQLTKAAP